MPFLKARYRFCELFGIPIYFESSLVILLFLFATGGGSLVDGIVASVVLAFSIIAHELGHALTARAFGYPTRDITLSLLGGCASLTSMPRKASQEFLTALAGPLVSFALAGCVFLLDVFRVPVANDGLRNMLATVFCINVMLGGFNLLPGYPMDGGRIFRSTMRLFLSRTRATFVAMWVGRIFAVLLGLRGLHAVFTRGGWGFVSILIAWMIWKEGYREYLAAREEERWHAWTQDDFKAKVSPPPYGRD